MTPNTTQPFNELEQAKQALIDLQIATMQHHALGIPFKHYREKKEMLEKNIKRLETAEEQLANTAELRSNLLVPRTVAGWWDKMNQTPETNVSETISKPKDYSEISIENLENIRIKVKEIKPKVNLDF